MSDRPEIQFIDGLIVKPPVKKDGSPLPDFIKMKGSIKRMELMAWLAQQEGEWVNFDVKTSKSTGKWYCSVDNWEPTKDQEYKEGMSDARHAAAPATPEGFEDLEDIPFANPYKDKEFMY